MPSLSSPVPFVTIDCPTALIRGQQALRGTVQPRLGDRLLLASGITVFFGTICPAAITTGKVAIFGLTTPLRGPWHALAASFLGEAYLYSSCVELSAAAGAQYQSLQQACRDYVSCWSRLSEEERRVFLHGAAATVSGVGAVLSGVAFVADLANGGLPLWQGLTCAASSAFCGVNLIEMSQAAQRGARHARELQGHIQWMTSLLLASDLPPETVIVGPMVSSYCTVVAQGFEGIQTMANRTIRSIAMSSGSIPGLLLPS